MSDRVSVRIDELADLGAQSRGARVFGVTVDDATRLSYEVPEDDYAGATVFFLIGFAEAMRVVGKGVSLITNQGRALVSTPDAMEVYDENDTVIGRYDTWSAALAAVTGGGD